VIRASAVAVHPDVLTALGERIVEAPHEVDVAA
jgi:hypothetical protein